MALCALLLAAAAARGEEFPYAATIAHLNVTARSGPSYGTYATERLPKHSQVEVYRVEGDWVAIRPPKQAFDWLPASSVKRTADAKVGEIVADDAAAWIGSNVKRVEKHVSQVQLKPGEKVQILGEKPGAEPWLKIAPPAGEFRWVQAKHLSEKSPEELAAEESAERLAREERFRRESAPGLLSRSKPEEREVLADVRDEEVEPAQFSGRGKAPLLSRKPKASKTAPKSDDVAIEGLQIENGQPSSSLAAEKNAVKDQPSAPGASSESNETAETKPPETPKAKPAISAGSQALPIDSNHFKELLTQLEVDLTVMVAGDSTTWRLKPLRERAQALVDDGPSALERGRARLVLDRIAEFEATLPADQENGPALAATPSGPVVQPAPAPKPEPEVRYDAVGYLMPVIGTRPGLPQFQLTDKDGNTIQYVSPAPGVNLNRYVKKQVGLYGQRGYLETLKKQHLTAQRVVDLDRHRR